MKRHLLMAVGAIVIFGSLFYVLRPVGHIPLYDANLVRLAETELQGYCSGETFWKSQGSGDSALAASCRSRLASKHSNRLNIRAVEPAFCRAILDQGWQGSIPECLNIMAQNQYWPTYDGTITFAWNRARPYPRTQIEITPPGSSSSRTGGRTGNTRESPTHSAPSTAPSTATGTDTAATETTTDGTTETETTSTETTETTETTTEEEAP